MLDGLEGLASAWGLGKNAGWSAAAAESAGLGAFRHSHMARNGFGHRVPAGLIVAGLGGAAHSGFGLQRWGLAFTAVGALVIALVAYAYFVDGRRFGLWAPFQPSRVAVYDGGLVLDTGVAAPRAVPWDAIVSSVLLGPSGNVGVVLHVVYFWDGSMTAFDVGPMTDRRSLVRSVANRSAAGVDRRPKVAAVGVGAAVMALFVVVVVLPRVRTRVVDEVPVSIEQFEDVCGSPGTAFSRAADYGGEAPHPTAVVLTNKRDSLLPPLDGALAPDDPEEVELVACIHLDGKVSSAGEYCTYGIRSGIGGPVDSERMWNGRYRVTLYEAATRRKVMSETVVGEVTECPEVRYGDEDVYTTLSGSQIHRLLDDFVER